MVEPRVMPVVKASEIVAMLEQGKSRKEIAQYYGIPTARLVKIMKACPQLAGKKKAMSPVEFVNDLGAQAIEEFPQSPSDEPSGNCDPSLTGAQEPVNQAIEK